MILSTCHTMQVLSRKPRWHLVDFSQMTSVFKHGKEHLHDVVYPAPWFSLEAFNIYLDHLVQELAFQP